MGDSDAAYRLYYEWESHNYGYYLFNRHKGLDKIIFFADIEESCKSVDFGVNKETGLREKLMIFINKCANF